MGFRHVFTITPAIATGLMRIEAVKQVIETLPVTARVLANLRETARLFSTHYSTMIEGNRLTQEQVVQVIGEDRHFPGRERDEDEVKGYYAALDQVERLVSHGTKVPKRPCNSYMLGDGARQNARAADSVPGWAERDSRLSLSSQRLSTF